MTLPSYGFADSHTGFFQGLDDEIVGIVELPDPDTCEPGCLFSVPKDV